MPAPSLEEMHIVASTRDISQDEPGSHENKDGKDTKTKLK
jgi:hypothetical protein